VTLANGSRIDRNGLFLCVVVAVGIGFSLVRQSIGHGDYLIDLRAFYCGGSVLLHHSDPYFSSSATDCVHSIKAGAAVMRAPHPPFALSFYALLALLPFKEVAVAYLVLAWLALGASAICLSKLAPIPSSIAALGLVPLLGYDCVSLGQPTPFVVLFIVLSACFLNDARPAVASVFAALTLVFPQIGIPIVAALFVCRRESRVALSISVALLALVGLVVLGLEANVHFVTVSLRAAQLQTIDDSGQYSLPWFLQQVHVSYAAASLIGLIWYLAVLVAGVVWLKLYMPDGRSALILLLPPALAALSSTYVHPQHFALALPLAMVCLCWRPRAVVPMLAGTALLLIPWNNALVATATASHDIVRALVFIAIGFSFATLFLISARAGAHGRFGRISVSRPLMRMALGAVAGSYLVVCLIIHFAYIHIANVDLPPNDLSTLALKLPTILGLVLVLAYGVFAPVREAPPVGLGGLGFEI
jgi:hypothetical protein